MNVLSANNFPFFPFKLKQKKSDPNNRSKAKIMAMRSDTPCHTGLTSHDRHTVFVD